MPGAVFESLEPVEPLDLDAPIPLGPPGEVLSGVLDCGLRYFVRQCAKPKQRAALALAVRVGSLAEEEAERGVAHIVEHLAFNGTENYRHHDIVAYLESIGASFGACTNAYTSADETVYSLMVPTSDLALLDKSISVLAEWAARIRCAPEDLARERGAVLEELRLSRDSAGRLASAHWKLLLQGCRYEDRQPIGLESVIKGVAAQSVAAFYRRWYRPHRMAVVAVGDFPEPHAVAAMIQQHLGAAFAAAGGSSSEAPQPGPELPSVLPSSWQHTEPRFCVFADREAADSALYLSWKLPCRPSATPGQYLEVIKDSLFMSCLNSRLFRLTRAREPPFFNASIGDEQLCAAVDLIVLAVNCQERQALRALEAVLTELARVRRHGFSAREFDMAVSDMQADIEATYLEAHQGYADDIRDEYVRHFLGGEFVSGQHYEARLNKALLGRISPGDLDARARLLTLDHSAVVKVTEHRKWCSEAGLRAVVARVEAAEAAGAIGPWQQADAPDTLMEQLPQVPGEWYTACGLQPPSGGSQPGSPLRAATCTDAPAARAGSGSLVGSPRQRQHGHHHPPCHSQRAAAAEKPGHAAAQADAAAGVEELQQTGQPQQQKQPREQPPGQPPQLQEQQQVAAVPRPPGLMLYPGVVGERHYEALGVRELTLVNGLVLALKETDFLADEVLLTAFAVGGLSEVPRARFYTASVSGVVAAQLGAFGHAPEALSDLLAGRRLALAPSEGAYARSVKGDASPAHLEHAMQLLHLLFTRPPSLDQGRLDSVLQQLRQGIEAQQRNPLAAYHRRLRDVNYGGCYFFRPIGLTELEQVDLAACVAHHAAAFSNPDEFTLVLTGAARFEALLPLATRYLATLPPAAGTGGRRDCRTLTPLPFAFPEAPVVEDVQVDMVSPLTQSQITLPVSLSRPRAREELWWLTVGCRCLETRLMQAMRFQFGDIYTVSVASFFGCEAPSSSSERLRGDLSIAFTCDPANKDKLVELALATLERLQEEGPSHAEVDTLSTIERLEFENLLAENSFWHDVIVNAYQSRRYAETGDLDAVWLRIRDSRQEMLDALAPDSLRDALRSLLPWPCRSRYTALTCMPRPPGLLGRLAFSWLTASPATRTAVLAGAGLGLAAAAAGLGLLLARRRAGVRG